MCEQRTEQNMQTCKQKIFFLQWKTRDWIHFGLYIFLFYFIFYQSIIFNLTNHIYPRQVNSKWFRQECYLTNAWFCKHTRAHEHFGNVIILTRLLLLLEFRARIKSFFTSLELLVRIVLCRKIYDSAGNNGCAVISWPL